MNYPRVSIIILNWNGWKDTIECLESVYQIDYANFDVILVDNHSQDDSLDKIRTYCTGVLDVKSEFFDYQTENKPINFLECHENETLPVSYDHELIIIKNKENFTLFVEPK